ncbi:MAG: hypothetical protein Q4G57_06905, partial [Bacillota bacterium]|nr:hypothetical protein [Bacillota bacterium]
MDIQKKNSAGRSGGVFAAFCCCGEIRKMQKTKRHLFSTHLEFASQILDVAKQIHKKKHRPHGLTPQKQCSAC